MRGLARGAATMTRPRQSCATREKTTWTRGYETKKEIGREQISSGTTDLIHHALLETDPKHITKHYDPLAANDLGSLILTGTVIQTS